jgi:hypothetical protein
LYSYLLLVDLAGMDLPKSFAGRSFPFIGAKNAGTPRSGDHWSSDNQRFCLELYHVLGLRALGTLGYFKFHRLFFRQGMKALALDGAVMHEDIGAFFPGDEAKTLGVVKPFYRTSFLHCETSCRYCNNIPPKKQGAQQSGKKNRPGDLATRPIIVQDSRPGFQSDMLNCSQFTRELLKVKLIKINACSLLRSAIEALK